jgi:hypothetical protein
MWLIRSIDWLLEVWEYVKYFALIGFILFILALVTKLSQTLKLAHEGFREIMTVRGMFALLIVIIIIIVVWTSMKGMIGHGLVF